MNRGADEILRCADRLDIQEALSRYAIHVDTGDAQRFSQLFTEDCVWAWEAIGLRIRGRAQVRYLGEMVYRHTRGAQHAVSNVVIEVRGDSASAISQVAVLLSKTEGIYPVMVGYYEDSLVRVEGRWLIAERRVRAENPEILSQGRIGEYFAPLIAALEQFITR